MPRGESRHMVGGRAEHGSRRRARAASVVVPFPRSESGNRLDLARLVPSGRLLLVVLGLLAAVLLAYRGAYQPAVFGVQRVDVRGAPPEVTREVEAATKHVVGTSLVAVDAEAIEGTLRALPSVAGVSVDRAFPHTLVVKVAAERPVAVVRRGPTSWFVTGSGKVISEIETGSNLELPRLWLARGVGVRVGGTLPAGFIPATRALAAVREARLPRRVKAVRSTGTELTLVLRRGPEIRLGEATDLLLKISVVAAVYPLLERGTVYVDVSVPERPVASTYFNP